MIWNFNTEDHVDGRHVTGIITVKDHDEKHHVTDTTATQQQSGNLRPTGNSV